MLEIEVPEEWADNAEALISAAVDSYLSRMAGEIEGFTYTTTGEVENGVAR